MPSYPRITSVIESNFQSIHMSQVIGITCASRDFDTIAAKALDKEGSIVNAGMRDPTPGIAFVKDTESVIEQHKAARLSTRSHHLRRSQKVCQEIDTGDTQS